MYPAVSTVSAPDKLAKYAESQYRYGFYFLYPQCPHKIDKKVHNTRKKKRFFFNSTKYF